jgi:hypothetical protein
MDTHPYGGPGNVIIDNCERCELNWLDYGELAKVQDTTKTQCAPADFEILGETGSENLFNAYGYGSSKWPWCDALKSPWLKTGSILRLAQISSTATDSTIELTLIRTSGVPRLWRIPIAMACWKSLPCRRIRTTSPP